MPPVVGASIDVGSNSVHLLVATVANHRLTPLTDESVFLGLGKAVADRGHLGPTARARSWLTPLPCTRASRAISVPHR